MQVKAQRTPREKIKQWWMDYSGLVVILSVYGGLFYIMGDEGWWFWIPLVAMVIIYGLAPVLISAHAFLTLVALWGTLKLVIRKLAQWTRLEKLLNRIGLEISR